MMVRAMQHKTTISFVLVGSLLILSGCFDKKEKAAESASQDVTNKGAVLLSIEGKPALYAQDYEERKDMMVKASPQFQMILQMIPDAEYAMFFRNIEATCVMKEWGVRTGLTNNPDFVEQLRQIREEVELQLYSKYFQEAHPVEVSEHDIKEFYHAKRDQIPGLVIAPAATEIAYVKFSSKEKADSFATKIKDGSEKHMKSAAKESGDKVETMKVSAQSSVDQAVKAAVLEMTKFPSKAVVKAEDGSFWVVGGLKKEEAQYHSLDNPQVKEFIKKACADEKREAVLTKQIEKLIKEYNVEENKAYFEQKKQVQNEAADQEVIDINLLNDKM